MPRVQSKLVDWTGRPVAYDFYESGQKYGPREHPWRFYYADQDTNQLLTPSSWRQIMSAARFLFANVPVVRGAVLEQASYSFPLRCNWKGADKAFGKKAEPWLFDWRKDNNIRGRPFNALHNSRLRLIGRKIDGDIATILTGDPDSGFPKVQLLRAHRIGSRTADGPIKSGKYAGSRMQNGVILDKFNRTIAFNVLGDTAAEDSQISARSMFLTFRPDVPDSARGISEMVASSCTFADIKRLREYEMRAQELAACIALIEKNEAGAPDPAQAALSLPPSGANVSGTASGLVTETFEKGMVKYFRTGSGAGLEAFRPSNRPAAEAQAWEDKILSGALYGMEWDPNFAMAIKEPGGAWARTIIQKINRAIANNVTVEAEACARENIYALGWAIDNGILPPPSDGDFFSWDITLGIPLITADSGNDRAADREAYKLGLTTMRDLSIPGGHFWDELRDQQQTEICDLAARVREVQKLFPELSFQEILALFQQRTPNATGPAAGAATSGPAEKAASPSPKEAEPEEEELAA
jgi:lambda family portal protein